MSFQWTLLDFRQQRNDAQAALRALVAMDPSLPAANRFEFIDGLAKHLFRDRPLYIAVARHANNVVAALPLMPTTRNKFGFRWQELSTPFSSHAALYALPAQHEMHLESLLESLLAAAEKWPLPWQRLALRLVMARQTHASLEYAGDCAWFSWDDTREINKIISPKLHKNLLRLRKRLQEKVTTVEFSVSTPVSLRSNLSDFFALEQAGWRGKNADSCIAGTAHTIAFYLDMMQAFADRNEAQVFTLKSADEILAAAIGFTFNDTVYLQSITFAEHHGDCAVGSQLVLSIFEHFLPNPSINHLSLTTCPEWCSRWHPTRHAVYNLTGYRRHAFGVVLRWLVEHWRAFKESVRPLRNRLRGVGSAPLRNESA